MGTTKMRYGILFSMLLTLAAFVSVSAQEVASTSRPADSSNGAIHVLQISTGDMLDVNVFDTPDLSGKVRVDDHGDITLPLAGALPVSGLTAEQAGRAVEAKLLQAAILKDPHVLVSVLEYATQGVTLLGEVKQPGVYPLLGPHDLLDLIS